MPPCGARRFRVLVDGISPREAYTLQARTEFQAPEVDGVVFLNDNVTIGEFATVTITRSLTYDLVGRVTEYRHDNSLRGDAFDTVRRVGAASKPPIIFQSLMVGFTHSLKVYRLFKNDWMQDARSHAE